jgi:hypothetical protein
MHTPTLVAALTGISLALANPAPAAAPQPIITPGAVLARAGGGGGAIDARQFVGSASDSGGISKSLSCSSLLSLVEGVPTAPAPVVEWMATAITVPALDDPRALTDDSLTSLCDATKTITPPASLTAAYSRYTQSVSAWASSAAPAAESVASSCGGLVSGLIMVQIATDSKECTSAVQELLQVARGELSSSTSGTADGTTVETVTQTVSSSGSTQETSETSTASTTGTESSGATSSTSTAGAAVGPRETGFLAAVAVGIAGAVAAL